MFYQMVKKIFKKWIFRKKQFDKVKNAVCAKCINSTITSTAW